MSSNFDYLVSSALMAINSHDRKIIAPLANLADDPESYCADEKFTVSVKSLSQKLSDLYWHLARAKSGSVATDVLKKLLYATQTEMDNLMAYRDVFDYRQDTQHFHMARSSIYALNDYMTKA